MVNLSIQKRPSVHASGVKIRRYYFSNLVKSTFIFDHFYDSLVFFTLKHQFQYFLRKKGFFNFSLDKTYLESIIYTKKLIASKLKNKEILPAHIPHAEELISYLEGVAKKVESALRSVKFEKISNFGRDQINELTKALKKEIKKSKISKELYAAILFKLIDAGTVKYDLELTGENKAALGASFCEFMSLKVSRGDDCYQEFRKYSESNIDSELLSFIDSLIKEKKENPKKE